MSGFKITIEWFVPSSNIHAPDFVYDEMLHIAEDAIWPAIAKGKEYGRFTEECDHDDEDYTCVWKKTEL